LGLLWLVIFVIAIERGVAVLLLQVLKAILHCGSARRRAADSGHRAIHGSVVLIALGIVVLGCAPDCWSANYRRHPVGGF